VGAILPRGGNPLFSGGNGEKLLKFLYLKGISTISQARGQS